MPGMARRIFSSGRSASLRGAARQILSRASSIAINLLRILELPCVWHARRAAEAGSSLWGSIISVPSTRRLITRSEILSCGSSQSAFSKIFRGNSRSIAWTATNSASSIRMRMKRCSRSSLPAYSVNSRILRSMTGVSISSLCRPAWCSIRSRRATP